MKTIGLLLSVLMILGWTFVFNAETGRGFGFRNDAVGADSNMLIIVYPTINTAYVNGWEDADAVKYS